MNVGNHIRQIRPISLSNTPGQGMMQVPHLDHTKGGYPHTGVQWHPPTCLQTIWYCVKFPQVINFWLCPQEFSLAQSPCLAWMSQIAVCPPVQTQRHYLCTLKLVCALASVHNCFVTGSFMLTSYLSICSDSLFIYVTSLVHPRQVLFKPYSCFNPLLPIM
jgi:hypothetical protein